MPSSRFLVIKEADIENVRLVFQAKSFDHLIPTGKGGVLNSKRRVKTKRMDVIFVV